MQIKKLNDQSNSSTHNTSPGVWLLIVLWSYAVFIKLADFTLYQKQMRQQVFPATVSIYLVYLILILEIIVLLCLIINTTKRLGLMFSLIMLIAFTFYVILILAGYFPNVPCSCGGFISKMSWKNHLWFNTLFILINLYTLIMLTKKERGLEAQHL